MTNYEFYKAEIEEIDRTEGQIAVDKNAGCLVNCVGFSCARCSFSVKGDSGYEHCSNNKMLLWAMAEYKDEPKLNKYERVLCEALNGGFLSRDKGGSLYLHERKPNKVSGVWTAAGMYTGTTTIHSINSNLRFDFIQWQDKEPWSVADLLKLEVEE